uniref:hypothetical protein n=1 Tax=Nitrospira cf. moscoviensis SBR1015 TaxID=96242 RepID=UPI00111D8752|nr:hypothetical protein [Nitrospira cf. moscoviensis SBR1015]
MPAPVKEDPPVVPPPPPPPPPAPTAQGLTIGKDRKAVPLRQFLSNAVGAARRKTSLVIPMGGTDAAAGAGLNIPQG